MQYTIQLINGLYYIHDNKYNLKLNSIGMSNYNKAMRLCDCLNKRNDSRPIKEIVL